MAQVIKANNTENVIEAIRGGLYEDVLGILGTTGTILPLGDAKHAPSSTTFTTVGEQQATFTWSKDPDTFDNSPSVQGLIPVITFDGVDEQADTPDAAFWTDPGGISWAFWIKLNTIANNILISKWDETTGSELREFKVYTDGDGKVNFQIYDETNNGAIGIKGTTVLTAGVWTQIGVTHSGGSNASNIEILVNGANESDATPVVDDAAFADMQDTATVVALGYEESTAGAKANFFDGSMAGGPLGPCFVSLTLSTDQMLRLYEFGRRALDL